MQSANVIMPYDTCKNHAYLYDVEGQTGEYDYTQGIRVPLNLDTEFVESPTAHTVLKSQVENRRGVTIQVSGALDGPEVIFVHPDLVPYAAHLRLPLRHPVMQSGFPGIDYLRLLGHTVTLTRCERANYVDKLPVCQFDCIAFFAVAELCMVCTDLFKEDVKSLVLQGAIIQNRRLATRDITRCDDWQLDYCRMPWIMKLDGHEFGIRLRWIDTSALHGIASYRDLLVNTGFDVDDKDLMKDLGLITKMDEAYFSHPDEFDRYAVGDLKNYQALVRNNDNFKGVYDALGLGPYFKSPYLTIGRTIADMFQASILQQFDVGNDSPSKNDDPPYLSTKDEVLKAACYYGNAAYFRIKVDSTASYLAKVFGGRCRPHRVTLTNFDGLLCDLDLAGCYGQGLRAQEYPLGRPFILHYPMDSHINAYPTLRQFLKDRHYNTSRSQLIPGLWTACMTLPPDYLLTHPQTFFPSWFGYNPRKDTNIAPVDEHIIDLQEPSLEMAVDSGNTKIFHNRIDNAVLTQDGLEWILYACSEKQREELLDQLRIVSAAYYNRKDYVATVDELRQRLQYHRGKNTAQHEEYDGMTTLVQTNQECYAWTSINLGSLLVDKLLANRQLYPKKPIHPLNTLYKLIVNGLFGDMVSPYFAVGNVVVGNNITARARAACWYMEASLNGIQSITDGVQFDVCNVVYPRSNDRKKRRITPEAMLELRYEHNVEQANKVILRPLDGYDTITYDSDTRILSCRRGNTVDRYGEHEIAAWINDAAMRHMQQLWSTHITVLHGQSSSLRVRNAGTCEHHADVEYVPRVGQFEFEMKALFTSGTFHSSANHLLCGDGKRELKYRAYNKRVSYDAYTLVDGVLTLSDYYRAYIPPDVFLEALHRNPRAVPRGLVYAYNKLIKPDQFRQRHRAFFKNTILDPGDAYVTCGLLKEFSLSQFTMQSPEQWRALEKEFEHSKKKYGQYVECFFVNSDGTVNVEAMLKKVQTLIDQGAMSLVKALDQHRHAARNEVQRMHPQFPTLQALRVHLDQTYGGYLEDDTVDSDYTNTMDFVKGK